MAYKDKQIQKEYNKAYKNANKDKLNTYSRLYYQAHKNIMPAKHKKTDAELREYKRIYNRNYRLNHLDEIKEYLHNYNLTRRNKEMSKKSQLKSLLKTKTMVLTHYGNGKMACVKCGFEDIRALTIDHINGNGSAERKIHYSGNRFYTYLKNHNFPSGYQTLCANCQKIKQVENKEWGKGRYAYTNKRGAEFRLPLL